MSGEPRDFRTARGEAGGEPRRASPTGTGHDAARCSACGLLGGDHTLWCAAAPAEPPVAAPDHADATPRPWAVDPAFPCQFGGDLQGSEGEWGMCVGETEDAEDAALIVQAVNERDAFLAERQQDKERIERLETTLEWALDCLEISLARLDTVDDLSPEHHRIRAAGLAKARAVLAGEGDATPTKGATE